MKTMFTTILILSFLSIVSAQEKQYKSAETGKYVTKSHAQKNPSTTYSTSRLFFLWFNN